MALLWHFFKHNLDHKYCNSHYIERLGANVALVCLWNIKSRKFEVAVPQNHLEKYTPSYTGGCPSQSKSSYRINLTTVSTWSYCSPFNQARSLATAKNLTMLLEPILPSHLQIGVCRRLYIDEKWDISCLVSQQLKSQMYVPIASLHHEIRMDFRLHLPALLPSSHVNARIHILSACLFDSK